MVENGKQVVKIDGFDSKETYRRPQLVVYGDVREITLTKQAAKTTDNPGKEVNMTGFK